MRIFSSLTSPNSLPRFELISRFLSLQVDQTWEHQDHVATLVHNGTMAICASHFTRELMFGAFGCWVVPFEIVMSM